MTTVDWEKLKEQGNDAFKSNAYDEAVKYYSMAIEANPSEPVLYSNRSAAYLKQGNFKAATADARKAVELDKSFARAYTRLHAGLCNSGEFHEAARALQEGIPAVKLPTDQRNLRELQKTAEAAARAVDQADRQAAVCNWDSVARLLRDLLRQFPDCPRIVFAFAEATVATDPDTCTKLLAPFAYSHSTDSYYLYLRALTLYYRGQEGLNSAQSILRQTLEMDPDNERARVLLKKIRTMERHKEAGNAAFKAKQPKEAVEAYTAAIEVDPTNSRVHATLRGNRAAARMDLKEYQAALLDCTFAINNGVTTARMYARRSRIQEHLESFDDAVRDMQQAAESDRSFEGELRQLKARSKKAKRKDYYKTLDLPQHEADQSAVKRAYRKACLQWHPDKWAHASEEEKLHAEKQFKEVGEAFTVLSDPQKKRLYDSGQLDNDVEGASGMAGMRGMGGMSGMGMGSDENFVNLMNMMFSGGGGGTFAFQQQQGFSGGGQRQHRGRPNGFYNM